MARTVWLLALLLMPSAGCRSFQRQGPVPKSLANCRQLQQQGIAAMERGDWLRSEELLNQAVRACPVDADARRRYAETLWHRGSTREAIAQLEEAGRLGGEDPEIAVRTGECYLATGQIDEARRAAERALDLDPKLPSAWALRGKTLEAQGQLRPALADFQRSLGYDADNQDALLQVAELYRRLNQPERALVALHSLIDSHPPGEEPQQLFYLQGMALVAVGRYNDAVESYLAAGQRGQPTAELLYRLAEAELLAGRSANAQIAARQALALEPAHKPTLALVERLRVAQVVPTAGRR